jgi:transposase
MWLLERLKPDFKTIANFRKDNGKGIKNVCREFVDFRVRDGMLEALYLQTNNEM